MNKKFALFMAQCLILILAGIPAGIASTSSYYLDASRLELQVSPTTDTASGVVRVSSNSNKPIRLKVIPKLWELSPQGVLTYQEPPKDKESLLDNIGINPEEFELLPGKSRLVRFIVKVPHDIENAEYPFQLYFQPTSLLEPDAKQQATAVNNVLDVVPIFTTTVYAYKGAPAPQVKVDGLQCGYQPDKRLVSVDLSLSNQGAKHARLFGNVIINRKASSGGSGQLVDVLHMQNSTLIIVMPGSLRTVKNLLELQKVSRLDAGEYQMDVQLVDERNIQPAIPATCNFTVPAG